MLRFVIYLRGLQKDNGLKLIQSNSSQARKNSECTLPLLQANHSDATSNSRGWSLDPKNYWTSKSTQNSNIAVSDRSRISIIVSKFGEHSSSNQVHDVYSIDDDNWATPKLIIRRWNQPTLKPKFQVKQKYLSKVQGRNTAHQPTKSVQVEKIKQLKLSHLEFHINSFGKSKH